MRREPLSDAATHLAALADEVERTRSRVLLTREGHSDVALVSAEELDSLDETAFWLRDEAERAREGEPPGAGEDGPGLNEEEIRLRYGNLLNRRDSA